MDGVYHYIDKKGTLIGNYNFCSSFQSGYAVTKKDNQIEIISKEMEVLYKNSLQEILAIHNISNGMFLVVDKNKKVGYMDQNFQIKIPCCYPYGRDFHEDFAIVELVKDQIIGFIDKNQIAISFFKDSFYEEIDNFHEGLSLVRNSKGVGYINKRGKEVIPCQYFIGGRFCEGLTYVFDGSFYYINKKGTKKITLPDLYCSTLTWGNKKIDIKAETKSELKNKKIEALKQIKEEAILKLESEFESAKQNILQR